MTVESGFQYYTWYGMDHDIDEIIGYIEDQIGVDDAFIIGVDGDGLIPAQTIASKLHVDMNIINCYENDDGELISSDVSIKPIQENLPVIMIDSTTYTGDRLLSMSNFIHEFGATGRIMFISLFGSMKMIKREDFKNDNLEIMFMNQIDDSNPPLFPWEK